jgi:folate-binding protein YgfZ
MGTTFPLDGAVRLVHWGVIRARGAEAAQFLHGQLTNDTEHLRPERAAWAGFCSAKGRLQASFLVCREGDEDLLLLCSADLLPPTLKRLSMFVLRAKCRLSDAGAELALWGLAGETARQAAGALPVLGRQALDGGAAVVRLPDADGVPRALWMGPAAALPAGLPALDAAAWDWLEVAAGVPRIVAATVEQFVPQMVNLELVGGVDFQKGCYPGQEIVARSQYRGTLKRRMQRFDADAALAPGQEVFHAADPGQPAGMVVNAAPAPGGGWSALVEVKLAALDGGRLHAGRADGALLRRADLPYALPSPEASPA